MRRGCLQGRVAWVTGAGRGLGRAIALAYAEAGAGLFLTARSADELEQTAKLASVRGAGVEWCTADVCSQAQVDAAHGLALDTYGQVDVLVNTAGALTLETNVTGIDRCTRVVLPVMKARRRGRVINLALEEQVDSHESAPPRTSTLAVVGFTRVLARELHADGVAVTAICLGEASRLLPSDVACAAVFLASDAAAAMTGVTLDVNLPR